MVDGQLMSIVNIILMSIKQMMDAGGKISALCLALIYVYLTVRALVEVKHII